MIKRRLLIYLIVPLVVAGAILYLDRDSAKQGANTSGPSYGPENAAFESMQTSEDKQNVENSIRSKKVSRRRPSQKTPQIYRNGSLRILMKGRKRGRGWWKPRSGHEVLVKREKIS